MFRSFLYKILLFLHHFPHLTFNNMRRNNLNTFGANSWASAPFSNQIMFVSMLLLVG